MKNIIYKTILFSLILITFSCSNDSEGDESEVDEPITMVGTWQLTSYTFENSYDFNGDGTSSNDFIEETNCFTDVRIIFNEDGTGEQIATSLSFTIIDDEIVMNCEPPTTVQKTWSLDGSELTVQSEGLGFKAIVDGNSFSYTWNADALVQFFFGDEYSDNETYVYTKVE
ncbi:DUF5004 domain-containing protein [Muricauda sp. CAU 1633]|uniref:DUF5004 domain-containing protein n=1 Tax=Allomuricauda sp. CAU 1633 TaxID=2816036 RepID=UPI001A8CB6B2|nr:DUF5004 domain-containing protein [Muricauda sp. CAU 1633]MBO0320738.1 DUF5004 domain-containing protein [Muricauda sp. CAU 1633]